MDAELDVVVLAESELVQIPLKVLLAAVLVDASHAALKHAEEAFDRVGGHVTTRVFLGPVVDGLMVANSALQAGVQAAFVGVQAD